MKSASGMLSPVAPALDAGESPVPVERALPGAVAWLVLRYGFVLAELVLVHFMVAADDRRLIDVLAGGVAIRIVVYVLALLPGMQWLERPVRPGIQASRTARVGLFVALQAFVVFAIVERAVPAWPLLLAGLIAPFVVQFIVDAVTGWPVGSSSRSREGSR